MAQIGTKKIYHNSQKYEVPVYEPSDVDYPFKRVYVNGKVGALPYYPLSESPSLDFRRVYHNNQVFALHDQSTTAGFTITATLDTDTATMVWYEDVDGDGEPENTTSFDLQSGTNTYSSGSLSLSSGNEIWFEVVDEARTVTGDVEIENIQVDY